ncbi:MAG: hypothetical protein L0I93_04370, partial [Atopostipes suicloacalis]|nr:hypothetical protein [Atopostipes suicloacalis]
WLLNPADLDLFIKTDNGHGLPEIAFNADDDKLENVAIVNQEILENPGKQFMRKRVVVYDTYNKKYVIRERNQQKYESVKKRYQEISTKFSISGKEITEQYRQYAKTFHSQDFWNDYLEQQKG